MILALRDQFKNKLKDKTGSMFALSVAVILSSLIIFTSVSEYLRLKLIAGGIKEALQVAVVSVSVKNYDNNYSQTREGYSAGYKRLNDRWEEQLDTGDIYEKLDELLGLNKEGDKHVKKVGGEVEYSLSGLSTNIINSPLAPNSNDDVFKAESYINVEIPLSFGWGHMAPLDIKLKVKSKYMARF